MRKRPHAPEQTALDLAAPEDPDPATETVADPPAEYSTEIGWVDTAGRTRTWILRDPHGTQMAAITTKRGAEKIADLLNRAEGIERRR